MSIIFRYVHVQRADGTLRRAPYVPVWVRNNQGQLLQILALVDSGADFTVIPTDLAELLGLRQDAYATTTAGIGGKVDVKKTVFSFEIKNIREHYSLSVPALILQDQNSDVPLLLGRNGFFEEFHVTFKQHEEKIILKKIDAHSSVK